MIIYEDRLQSRGQPLASASTLGRLTRTTLALGDGDVGAAFGFHPLAPLVLMTTLAAALTLARGFKPGFKPDIQL